MAPLVVLLVDSSALFLQGIQQLIQISAAEQILIGGVASDGMQALALAERLQPDVVLWGIGMPALSQLQLLPRLRATLPQAGIIVMGLLEEGYQQASLVAGADMFLLKDDLMTTLLPGIMKVARR
ncbi:MAG TPA: response regulator transcription factor [Roseiflexaceae bacterium]|nr:response regulator transcription factor [Roseiflexaceae bacterium]